MIDIQNLTKTYGRFTAVKNLSFQVGAGQVVGFLGPNGAGKTTTLRMLTGYLPPTSGTASIAGHDIFKDSVKARQQIGYMPENVPLYDDMRVREYLKFRANIKGMSGRDARNNITETIETCGLTHMRKRMIKTLSKGYRQRVGLADALLNNPQLLVLDEPTNGLDPNQIRSIRRLIKKLGENHTILVSSHILSEVEMIAGISLEIQGDSTTIVGALERLENVKKVILDEQEGEGELAWNFITILCDSGTDTRSSISQLASQYGWPVRTLYRRKGTLEDVFVELTRKD